MKHFISLSTLIFVIFIAANASAITKKQSASGNVAQIVGGIKYVITSDTTVKVTYPNDATPSASNPSEYSGQITIPAEVEIGGTTYKVTAIGDYAFHFANITALSLPEGLDSLGYKAIYQTQLTEIKVPNSVTIMAYEALGYNKKLQTITFGENIAKNTWGDKLCIYGDKKYDVYMYCKSVPTLRSYTFFSTGATVHVYPMMYQAFKSDAAWSQYDIVGDLWIEYSYQDLQETISTYKAILPAGDAVGTDPGCFSITSSDNLAAAIATAESLSEDASVQQLNEAINNILIAYDALEINPLNEGYYYITNAYKPATALYADSATATTEGLKITNLNADDSKFVFKLTRHGNGWDIQSADNGMYVGTPGGTGKGLKVSLTQEATYPQIITWAKGGNYTIQCQLAANSTSRTYRSYGNVITTYTYASGDSNEPRAHWRFHPLNSDKYLMDYNLENVRVRDFLKQVEYSNSSDASKVSSYNVAPPSRRDQPAPATIFWTRDTLSVSQQLIWSKNADFSDSTALAVDNNAAYYEIFNLIPGNTYYYKVVATLKDGQTKELLSSSFTTSGQLRQIKVNSVANVRDLGGWPTASGYAIRYGLIYRGAELNNNHNVEPEDAATLRDIGIRAELDLRSNSEAGNIKASALGSEVEYKRISLGQTSTYYKGLTTYRNQYIQDVKYVFSCVQANKPVYFHCAIGADRTGTLAFLLEGVLGVSESDIYKDYELTTFSFFNTTRTKGSLTEAMALIKSIPGQTLEEQFYNFFTDSLGINAADVDTFRTKMLGLPSDYTPTKVHSITNQTMNNNAIYAHNASHSYIYDISGHALPSLQKGVNILIGTDGKKRKIIVR